MSYTFSALKPGDCPEGHVSGDRECRNECFNDASCVGDHKCCPMGCSYICRAPAPNQTISEPQPAYVDPPTTAG